jgi:hypothetical protein
MHGVAGGDFGSAEGRRSHEKALVWGTTGWTAGGNLWSGAEHGRERRPTALKGGEERRRATSACGRVLGRRHKRVNAGEQRSSRNTGRRCEVV